MPPPMSALITAKDANDDLVEVVLFEKFNDLRGFGRRLFLPFDQAGYLYFCFDEFRNVSSQNKSINQNSLSLTALRL